MSAKTFRIAGWMALLAGAGLFLFAWSGIYNIAASSGHYFVTKWFLEFGLRNSVGLRARGVADPPPFDAALLERGIGHYQGECAYCHGAPGIPPSRSAAEMLPPPPDLAEKVGDWSDKELFWIVKHGIKYTGMPAWPTQARDDEVWAVVAFLRRLPRTSPEEYRKLTGLPPADSAPPALPTESTTATASDPLTCARCHGPNGRGSPAGGVPRLAGQKADYLAMALDAFASGQRPSGIMQPVVTYLSSDERKRLAQHFAGRTEVAGEASPSAPPPPSTADRELIALGASIAANGVPEQKMPACAGCHGEQGGGANMDSRYPALAGLSADYLEVQLDLFRSGVRGGPLANIMTKAIPNITDEQIRAVAHYYESVRQSAFQPGAPQSDTPFPTGE